MRTFDLMSKLPDDAPRAAGFCQNTARNMVANTHPVPGERTAAVYSARLHFDDTTESWTADVLFKMRHRNGKIRNHRMVLVSGGRGTEPVCTIDRAPLDVYGALHPRVNKVPRTQYPSILAKRIIAAAETAAVRIAK